MISKRTATSIARRIQAYEKAREVYDPKKYKRGGGYSKKDIATIEQIAGTSQPTNEELSAFEEYEWITSPPSTYFAYYDFAKGLITNWAGVPLGRIIWKGVIQRRFSGKTQNIRVMGTNGKMYSGTCNISGGDYCRLRVMKARR